MNTAETLSPTGRILATALAQRGLNAASLAALAGVPFDTVQRILDGSKESPSSSHLALIAEALDLQDRHLLGFIALPQTLGPSARNAKVAGAPSESNKIEASEVLTPRAEPKPDSEVTTSRPKRGRTVTSAVASPAPTKHATALEVDLALVHVPALHARAQGNVITVYPGKTMPFFRSVFSHRCSDHEFLYHFAVEDTENSPRMGPGDCVLIDVSNTQIVSAAFYAIFYQGKARLHRVVATPDGCRTAPMNPSYPSVDLNSDQAQILGRAIYLEGSYGLNCSHASNT